MSTSTVDAAGSATYVHGYGSRESSRLVDQASTLVDLLHSDTVYPPASHVLEAGCGVGAQTVTLASRNPGAQFTSIDLSETSLRVARRSVSEAGLQNVIFARADIFDLPYALCSFDHVFVCFVLEHLSDPQRAIHCLLQVLKPGGSLTVIEGDHGSAYFHPDSAAARRAIDCLITLQARAGGDALIGRRLYPLLVTSGLEEVRVSPRCVYVDGRRPDLADGFTRKTFSAMVEGVGAAAVQSGLIDMEQWTAGVRALYRTAEPDGTFCYTFFKAKGTRPVKRP